MLVELIALRNLYERDHLDQVLATFGLILFFNELVAILWGRSAIYSTLPQYLTGHVELVGSLRYPLYRLVIIGVGLAVAGLLWFVVARTRLGMLIRAGASNRTMVAALGVNIRLLYTVVFGFGAALAGLAGLLAGPIFAVQPGMGELILIQVFVVIVIGGIGSIRGAFAGALIVGMVDTLGPRVSQAALLSALISPAAGDAAGPGARVDADLPADGGRAGVPARKACSRRADRNDSQEPESWSRCCCCLPRCRRSPRC